MWWWIWSSLWWCLAFIEGIHGGSAAAVEPIEVNLEVTDLVVAFGQLHFELADLLSGLIALFPEFATLTKGVHDQDYEHRESSEEQGAERGARFACVEAWSGAARQEECQGDGEQDAEECGGGHLDGASHGDHL